MERVALPSVDILKLAIDVSCDTLDQAVIVYDRSDTLLFASKQLMRFFSVPAEVLLPGTPVRKLLSEVYRTVASYNSHLTGADLHGVREDWVGRWTAALWSERFESVERVGTDRWFRIASRRGTSGVGVAVLQDITDIHKHEKRWQTDMERVALTEKILDEMPYPMAVKDSNLSYVAVNRAFLTLFNLENHNRIIGRTAWDVGELDGAADEQADRHVLQTGETLECKVSIPGEGDSTVDMLERRYCVGEGDQKLLVCMLSDVLPQSGSGNSTDVDARDVDPAGRAKSVAAAPKTLDQKVEARALVVTSDRGFAAGCVQAMAQHEIDACGVFDASEASTFIEAAGQSGIAIDLLLADDENWPDCIEIAARHSISLIPVNKGRPVSFILGDVAANLFVRDNAEVTQQSKLWDNFLNIPDFEMLDGPDQPSGSVYGEVEVLVVEDNPVNQDAFAHILAGLGITFTLARDPTEAVQLFEDIRPQLVLMDTTLPEPGAYAAARQIASLNEGRKFKTPVVAVLPKEDAQLRRDCAAVGMVDCIVKPISTEAIEKVYRNSVLNLSRSANS